MKTGPRSDGGAGERLGSQWAVRLLDDGDDLDEVLAIARQSFPSPWTRTMFRRYVAQRDVSRLYVLREAAPENPNAGLGPIVGYCATWLIVDELQVNNFAIAPWRRRQGAGRALLAHVLSDAGTHGAQRATLELRAANRAARGLYERVGFRVTAVRRGYYARPLDDALIMWTSRMTVDRS